MENSSVSVPYDWLKTLPPEILRLDEIPLLGYPPPFPWEQLSASLSKLFEIPFHIEPGTLRWRGEEELYQDLGEPLTSTHITVSGFDGKVYWLMKEQDINALMKLILMRGEANYVLDADPEFREGFYTFFEAELIRAFSNLDFDKTLTPHILTDKSLPEGQGLGLDVKVVLDHKTLWGRFIITPQFRQSWKNHFGQRKQNVMLPSAIAEKIPLSLHVEIGRVELPVQEWNELSLGDYIVLDSCTYDPQEEKGRATLTLNSSPLFRARLKSDNVKILEFPLSYHEEYASMEKEPREDDEWDDETEEEFDESDDDLDIEDEELPEEDEELDEEAIDEDDDELDDKHEEMDLEEDADLGEEIKPLKSSTSSRSLIETDTQRQDKKPLSPNDIPISVVIEVGRIQLSVGKLLELQPGNLLDIGIKPENGVDLVVNGKCVGKAELLRIGDTLGVRILDLS